jgi:hypothetical protein
MRPLTNFTAERFRRPGMTTGGTTARPVDDGAAVEIPPGGPA